jgi:hypothetical protein
MSTANSTPKSGKDLLAKIQPRRPKGRTQICLRPDLIREWETENEKLAEESLDSSSRLAGQGPTKQMTAQAKKVQKLEDQVEDASVWFHMEALDPDEWNELADMHPPRKDRQFDLMIGYNPEAVLDQAVRDCTYDPVFETCETEGCDHSDCGTWEALRRSLNGGEWEELRKLARELNSGSAAAPKSPLALSILAQRDSDSAPRGAGQARRRGGSTGGSRASSTGS